ncbi:MAG: hypothetical protein WC373_06910 [Smithella sp.]
MVTGPRVFYSGNIRPGGIKLTVQIMNKGTWTLEMFSLKNQHIIKRLKDWALPLLIPVLFFSLIILVFSTPVFEFNPDEGGNLMKAMLLDQGYNLYSQIWSDQPPLFTHALAWLMHFWGYDVECGRVLVLLSSCLLLWGAFLFLRIAAGTGQALIGTMVLTWIPHFLQLSYSVMNGLPAMALAMMALAALAAWHRSHSPMLLILSALLLVLSVLIKVFTIFLFPIFFLGIALSLYGSNEAGFSCQRYRPAILFFSAFAAVLMGLSWLLIGFDNIQALLQPHLLARHVEKYKNITLYTVFRHHDWQLLFLALAGSIIAIRQHRWLLLYPVAWATVAAVILSQHNPVWTHQLLLVTVPAAMLVPSTLEAFWKLLKPPINKGFLNWRGAIIVLLIILCFHDATKLVLRTQARYRVVKTKVVWNWQMAATMAMYAPQTRWVVTDRPMFAFRNGLLVPPGLAVLSDKRLQTSSLEKQLPQIIRQVQPEQVALARFQWPQMLPYLRQHYKLVFSAPGLSLFVRSDLVSRLKK